ncbi:hypothetical protein CXU19_12300 [Akkermansia muciniphila]|jgi:hypothetical protein|nr:hypothetical protein CXU19_12300 [Akkermansia muciniphila]PNC39990.1 hypothetical protein CXU20_01200 [Akkermansia muciniphila]
MIYANGKLYILIILQYCIKQSYDAFFIHYRLYLNTIYEYFEMKELDGLFGTNLNGKLIIR